MGQAHTRRIGNSWPTIKNNENPPPPGYLVPPYTVTMLSTKDINKQDLVRRNNLEGQLFIIFTEDGKLILDSAASDDEAKIRRLRAEYRPK